MNDEGPYAEGVPVTTPTIAPEPTDPIDTAALLALAKAATPGPWGYVEAPMFNGVLAARRDIATTGPRSDPRSKADGLFIAAANPETVTRLCEEVERLTRNLSTMDHFAEVAEGVERTNNALDADLARLRAFAEGVRELRDEWSVADASMRLHAPGVPSIALRDTAGRLTALLATLDKEDSDER